MNHPQPARIELRIDRVAQIFDTLDPLPFRERDLDSDAEAFIVGWAREIPGTRPIELLVHLPKSVAESEPAREIGGAIKGYFRLRADAVTNDLKELFRVGRYSLAIGIVVLAVCITMSSFVGHLLTTQPVEKFLEESLIILGWVANWRPIEIFLYDWYPLIRRRDLFRRLAAAEVRLQPY